jgi:hypothetical protein
MEIIIMSWNNVLLLSAGMFLFSGIAQAEKINCPETLKKVIRPTQ